LKAEKIGNYDLNLMDKREFLVGINSKINANDQENDELIK
jgi:hypothetical protein